MNSLILVLALAIGASAGRPGAQEVINTFKDIIPQYADTKTATDQELLTVQERSSDAIVSFHTDIMLVKETFVLSITRQEDDLQALLSGQNLTTADGQCMQFILNATNENVNLIGVAYTTCINAADESLNVTAMSYYGRLGALEQTLSEMRLLDVFRGDNVFYTPDNIVAKLRQKLPDLSVGTTPMPSLELEEELEAFQQQLEAVRGVYIGCMTMAEMSFRRYISLAQQQLIAICGGIL